MTELKKSKPLGLILPSIGVTKRINPTTTSRNDADKSSSLLQCYVLKTPLVQFQCAGKSYEMKIHRQFLKKDAQQINEIIRQFLSNNTAHSVSSQSGRNFTGQEIAALQTSQHNLLAELQGANPDLYQRIQSSACFLDSERAVLAYTVYITALAQIAEIEELKESKQLQVPAKFAGSADEYAIFLIGLTLKCLTKDLDLAQPLNSASNKEELKKVLRKMCFCGTLSTDFESLKIWLSWSNAGKLDFLDSLNSNCLESNIVTKAMLQLRDECEHVLYPDTQIEKTPEKKSSLKGKMELGSRNHLHAVFRSLLDERVKRQGITGRAAAKQQQQQTPPNLPVCDHCGTQQSSRFTPCTCQTPPSHSSARRRLFSEQNPEPEPVVKKRKPIEQVIHNTDFKNNYNHNNDQESEESKKFPRIDIDFEYNSDTVGKPESNESCLEYLKRLIQSQATWMNLDFISLIQTKSSNRYLRDFCPGNFSDHSQHYPGCQHWNQRKRLILRVVASLNEVEKNSLFLEYRSAGHRDRSRSNEYYYRLFEQYPRTIELLAPVRVKSLEQLRWYLEHLRVDPHYVRDDNIVLSPLVVDTEYILNKSMHLQVLPIVDFNENPQRFAGTVENAAGAKYWVFYPDNTMEQYHFSAQNATNRPHHHKGYISNSEYVNQLHKAFFGEDFNYGTDFSGKQGIQFSLPHTLILALGGYMSLAATLGIPSVIVTQSALLNESCHEVEAACNDSPCTASVASNFTTIPGLAKLLYRPQIALASTAEAKFSQGYYQNAFTSYNPDELKQLVGNEGQYLVETYSICLNLASRNEIQHLAHPLQRPFQFRSDAPNEVVLYEFRVDNDQAILANHAVMNDKSADPFLYRFSWAGSAIGSGPMVIQLLDKAMNRYYSRDKAPPAVISRIINELLAINEMSEETQSGLLCLKFKLDYLSCNASPNLAAPCCCDNGCVYSKEIVTSTSNIVRSRLFGFVSSLFLFVYDLNAVNELKPINAELLRFNASLLRKKRQEGSCNLFSSVCSVSPEAHISSIDEAIAVDLPNYETYEGDNEFDWRIVQGHLDKSEMVDIVDIASSKDDVQIEFNQLVGRIVGEWFATGGDLSFLSDAVKVRGTTGGPVGYLTFTTDTARAKSVSTPAHSESCGLHSFQYHSGHIELDCALHDFFSSLESDASMDCSLLSSEGSSSVNQYLSEDLSGFSENPSF